MKKILFWFFLSCKINFKKPAYLLFLIGLPLIMLQINELASSQNEDLILVGIYSENPDSLTRELISELLLIDGAVKFHLYDSKEDLLIGVKNGSIECGYEFPNNLRERIEKMSYKKSIHLITSPSTILSPITNEVVFGVISSLYGSDIASLYVKNSGFFHDKEKAAVQFVKDRYDFYNSGGGAFQLSYEYLDSSSNITPPLKSTSVMPVRGLLAVLIFIAALFSCVTWFEERETGSLSALPNYLYRSSKYLTLLATLLPLSVSLLITLKLTATWEGVAKEFASLTLYLVLIMFFCGILTAIINNSLVLASLIPFYSIASLIFCPVFIDLSTIIPMLSTLEKLFPPFYYLNMF